MKRQISISIILSILIVILVVFYAQINQPVQPDDNRISTEDNEIQSEESITISEEYKNCLYYIKDKDGRLVVYDAKTQGIYMETSIETYTLPAEILEKLEGGILFQTEEELLDFLESYSS